MVNSELALDISIMAESPEASVTARWPLAGEPLGSVGATIRKGSVSNSFTASATVAEIIQNILSPHRDAHRRLVPYGTILRFDQIEHIPTESLAILLPGSGRAVARF